MIHKIKAMYDERDEQSIRGIAQVLRLSRNTVRKYLKQSVEEINAGLGQVARPKKLDDHKPSNKQAKPTSALHHMNNDNFRMRKF